MPDCFTNVLDTFAWKSEYNLKDSSFEENEKAQNITDYKVFYKQNNRSYEPFNENSTPNCGMLQLKIIYKEYSATIVKFDNADYIIVEDKDVLATL